MKLKMLFIAFILPTIILGTVVFAREHLENSIAILPFNSMGVDESTVHSAEAILRLEISAASDWTLVPESKIHEVLGNQLCDELDCAVDIGKKLNASRALICNLTGLGEKILIYYTLVDVNDEKILIQDKATALYLEDLDAVLKRVAVSVSSAKPIERTADVNNITANESRELLRRSTNTLTGFTFSYLFPQSGYDDDDRSFSIDFRLAQELNPFEIGLLLAARKGFAMNIFGNYLFTRTDICPYLGGAFGFHWVAHKQNEIYNPQTGTYEEKRRGDGFELTFNGGLKLFRTYNFQVLLNFGYLMTFNDYNDRATVFTIGLVK